jgi:hypothetical protein
MPPRAAPSTRMLTVSTWVSIGIVALLIPLMILWLIQGLSNLNGLRRLAVRAAVVLWWLPGTSRALEAKAALRASPMR